MAIETKNLHDKLKALPEEVRIYAISSKGAEINSRLFKRFKVEPENQSRLTLILAKAMVKDIEIEKIEDEMREVLGSDFKDLHELALYAIGARLLIIDEWFNGKIETYLQQKGANPADFASLIAQQKLAVEEEQEDLQEEIKEDEPYVFEAGESSVDDVLDKDMDEIGEISESEERDKGPEINLGEEKNNLLNLLSSGLLDLLKREDREELHEFNYSFIYVWGQDENFSQEVVKALTANNEKLSSNSLEFEGEKQRATVANLLKFFIKKYGLNPNDLNIAEFLSSKMVNSLGDGEKVLALRILKFYNNLGNLNKYLQEDFENVSDGFEVLPPPAPVSNKKESKEGVNRELSKKTPVKVREKIEPKEKQEEEGKQGVKIKTNQGSSLQDELELMLQDYEPGTLEHRTISQEIKRLKAKNGEV